jgi:DNA-binding MarR family transcriptional regulator
MTEPSRAESLRHLEREVSVLIRRVRRVIGVRARLVHEELQPASYLMLSWLVDQGPVRASSMVETFDIDKGAVSRQLHHLDDLGLVERTPDPADGRATLVAASDDAVRRLGDVSEHRRKWLDEQLGDWTAEELAHFGQLLERYNRSLGA